MVLTLVGSRAMGGGCVAVVPPLLRVCVVSLCAATLPVHCLSLAAPPPSHTSNNRHCHVCDASDCVCTGTGFYIWNATAAMSVANAMDLSQTQLGVLFALYAAPNVFMPIVVSILGAGESALWPATLLLVTGITVGGWLSYFAVRFSWFWLLLIGRLVFGYVPTAAMR